MKTDESESVKNFLESEIFGSLPSDSQDYMANATMDVQSKAALTYLRIAAKMEGATPEQITEALTQALWLLDTSGYEIK